MFFSCEGLLGSLVPAAEEVVGIWGFPKIGGTSLWGPYNKDPTIWGTYYIRVSYFSETPICSYNVYFIPTCHSPQHLSKDRV